MNEPVITAAARADLDNAIARYEQEGADRANHFCYDIFDLLIRIAHAPDSIAEVQPNLRRGLMPPWPYGVYFTLHVDRACILAVQPLPEPGDSLSQNASAPNA